MIVNQKENVAIVEEMSAYMFGQECQELIDQGFEVHSVYVDSYMYKAVLIKKRKDGDKI